MKIVYIGSFNPITIGHVKIMEYLLDKFNNSSILVVPTSDMYVKDTLNTSFDDRYNMIKLAINRYKNIEVSDIENILSRKLLRNPKTIETLYTLRGDICLFIGSDNYLDLDNRYHVEELINKFKVIVYPRGDFNKSDVKLYKRYKDRFIFLDEAEILDISSSYVRECIKNGKDTDNLLDSKVLKYIKDNNLYR